MTCPPLPRSQKTTVVGRTLAAANGHSGVAAAETGESDAQERGRECSARDGTVGVAQYVVPHLTGRRAMSQRKRGRNSP